MIEFKLLDDLNEIKDYIQKTTINFCDISLGVRYMWRDVFTIEYAVFNDTLILKEKNDEKEESFYFPIGDDCESALKEIEEYASKKGDMLRFVYIDKPHVDFLKSRYKEVQVSSLRDWCDYVYEAEKFTTYSGKKLSGQRNHLNKFKKTYPDYSFHKIEKKDIPEIKEFLKNFENEHTFDSVWAIKEEEKVPELLDHMEELNQEGGYIRVNGKIVAIAVGEKVGNTLIEHVEKALIEYEGVYPTMASEFVKAFLTPEIKYLNREEDCGDLGLRTSKTQYHPLEIKEKNLVEVKTLFDKIKEPKITTERLTITDIYEADKETYATLYLDEELNKFWGYDYREDESAEPSPEYFYSFMKGLKAKKEEYSFAVRIDGKMIGELVLYNFDFFGRAEIGYRFFLEYQGKGYGTSSVKALIDYYKDLGGTGIKVRCFKENKRSINLIEKLGFIKSGEDKEKIYLIKDL